MTSGHRAHRVARRRALTTAVVVAIIGAFVASTYQPWLAQWGTTGSERRRPMVGDELVPQADTVWTRAITIEAPPARVWPWLVQMGADKAGFYNYDWGEQLFGDPIHNATTIHPEWQNLRVGGVVHPKPGGDWVAVAVEPDRALVLDNPLADPTDWTWATELRRLPDGRTRLVTRIRGAKGSFFSYALDVPDLVLFPRLLTGIKQRAEGTLPGMAGTHTGRPFPLARLPVHWWTALAWLGGLAALATLVRRPLAGGAWRRRRPHPWMTFWLGFVVGAGYLIMADTPPVQFFTHHWAVGLAAGLVGGVALGRRTGVDGVGEGSRRRWISRAVVTGVETGLFVVLPVTAVWQGATALGWTSSLVGAVAVRLVAVAAAAGVATLAWQGRRGGLVGGAVGAAYALTGSGAGALVAALVLELSPSGRPRRQPLDRGRRTGRPHEWEGWRGESRHLRGDVPAGR